MATCAICVAECAGDRKAPLGRNDAMVIVCSDCDTLPARAYTGPDRSYEPTGGLPSYRESQCGIEKALGKDYKRLTRLENAVAMTPAPPTDAADLARFESREALRRSQRIGGGSSLTVHGERAHRRHLVSRKARGL